MRIRCYTYDLNIKKIYMGIHIHAYMGIHTLALVLWL